MYTFTFLCYLAITFCMGQFEHNIVLRVFFVLSIIGIKYLVWRVSDACRLIQNSASETYNSTSVSFNFHPGMNTLSRYNCCILIHHICVFVFKLVSHFPHVPCFFPFHKHDKTIHCYLFSRSTL